MDVVLASIVPAKNRLSSRELGLEASGGNSLVAKYRCEWWTEPAWLTQKLKMRSLLCSKARNACNICDFCNIGDLWTDSSHINYALLIFFLRNIFCSRQLVFRQLNNEAAHSRMRESSSLSPRSETTEVSQILPIIQEDDNWHALYFTQKKKKLHNWQSEMWDSKLSKNDIVGKENRLTYSYT